MASYVAKDDDEQPVTQDWLVLQKLESNLVRVNVLAVNSFYDAIEIWNHPDEEEDPNPSGVLAIRKYPILRGDVRMLCFGLGMDF